MIAPAEASTNTTSGHPPKGLRLLCFWGRGTPKGFLTPCALQGKIPNSSVIINLHWEEDGGQRVVATMRQEFTGIAETQATVYAGSTGMPEIDGDTIEGSTSDQTGCLGDPWTWVLAAEAKLTPGRGA